MTGGGRGLGRGMALALAAGGAKVMVAARTEEQLLGVVDEIRQAGGTAAHFVYDATSEDDANALVSACVAEYGRVDVMFANAGGGSGNVPNDFWDYPTEVYKGTLATNLDSAFYACRAASRQMIEQGSGGVVVPTASGTAMRGNRQFAYPTAKGGVISLAKSMATMLGPHGIRSNCIVPGYVSQRPPRDDRERAEREQRGHFIPVDRLGEWWELGPLAVFLASDASSYITGQTFIIDGGGLAGGLGPAGFRPVYDPAEKG